MIGLAHPWVLLLILLPIAIYFLPRASLKLSAALYIPFYQSLQAFMEKEPLHRIKKPGLFFIIWVLAVAALAGPRWVGDPLTVNREGRNILLVLDLSGSMELQDMIWQGQAVSRLAVVKYTAREFVESRTGDRMGLILFGSNAYLQTPLTFDRHNLLTRIDEASVGLAGKTTSIGDALGLAVKKLQPVPEQSRVIILLTDGINNSGILDPLKAATLAKNEGIKVYTIGLGSDLPLNTHTDLDEKTLQTIADMTGGRYFRAMDPASLAAIYQVINQLEVVNGEEKTLRPQKDYYPWLLALAFMLLLFYFAEKSVWRRAKS